MAGAIDVTRQCHTEYVHEDPNATRGGGRLGNVCHWNLLLPALPTCGTCTNQLGIYRAGVGQVFVT